jgi:hypothetical protein
MLRSCPFTLAINAYVTSRQIDFMMAMLSLIKICLVPFYLINAIIISDKLERFEQLNGYRCHEGNKIFESTKSASVLDCARVCSVFPTCSGIFYQRDTLTCVACRSQCNVNTTENVMTGSVFYKRKGKHFIIGSKTFLNN